MSDQTSPTSEAFFTPPNPYENKVADLIKANPNLKSDPTAVQTLASLDGIDGPALGSLSRFASISSGVQDVVSQHADHVSNGRGWWGSVVNAYDDTAAWLNSFPTKVEQGIQTVRQSKNPIERIGFGDIVGGFVEGTGALAGGLLNATNRTVITGAELASGHNVSDALTTLNNLANGITPMPSNNFDLRPIQNLLAYYDSYAARHGMAAAAANILPNFIAAMAGDEAGLIPKAATSDDVIASTEARINSGLGTAEDVSRNLVAKAAKARETAREEATAAAKAADEERLSGLSGAKRAGVRVGEAAGRLPGVPLAALKTLLKINFGPKPFATYVLTGIQAQANPETRQLWNLTQGGNPVDKFGRTLVHTSSGQGLLEALGVKQNGLISGAIDATTAMAGDPIGFIAHAKEVENSALGAKGLFSGAWKGLGVETGADVFRVAGTTPRSARFLKYLADSKAPAVRKALNKVLSGLTPAEMDKIVQEVARAKTPEQVVEVFAKLADSNYITRGVMPSMKIWRTIGRALRSGMSFEKAVETLDKEGVDASAKSVDEATSTLEKRSFAWARRWAGKKFVSAPWYQEDAVEKGIIPDVKSATFKAGRKEAIPALQNMLLATGTVSRAEVEKIGEILDSTPDPQDFMHTLFNLTGRMVDQAAAAAVPKTTHDAVAAEFLQTINDAVVNLYDAGGGGGDGGLYVNGDMGQLYSTFNAPGDRSIGGTFGHGDLHVSQANFIDPRQLIGLTQKMSAVLRGLDSSIIESGQRLRYLDQAAMLAAAEYKSATLEGLTADLDKITTRRSGAYTSAMHGAERTYGYNNAVRAVKDLIAAGRTQGGLNVTEKFVVTAQKIFQESDLAQSELATLKATATADAKAVATQEGRVQALADAERQLLNKLRDPSVKMADFREWVEQLAVHTDEKQQLTAEVRKAIKSGLNKQIQERDRLAAKFLRKQIDYTSYLNRGNLVVDNINRLVTDYFVPAMLSTGGYVWRIAGAEAIPNILRFDPLALIESRLGVSIAKRMQNIRPLAEATIDLGPAGKDPEWEAAILHPDGKVEHVGLAPEKGGVVSRGSSANMASETPEGLTNYIRRKSENALRARDERTEWIDINEVAKYREYDRLGGHAQLRSEGAAQKYIDELKQDIKENGFKTELQIEYNPKNGLARLGEGNHRLIAAEQLGLKSVPVLVVRNSGIEGGRGGFLPRVVEGGMERIIPDDFGYVPGQMKPTELLGEGVKAPELPSENNIVNMASSGARATMKVSEASVIKRFVLDTAEVLHHPGDFLSGAITGTQRGILKTMTGDQFYRMLDDFVNLLSVTNGAIPDVGHGASKALDGNSVKKGVRSRTSGVDDAGSMTVSKKGIPTSKFKFAERKEIVTALQQNLRLAHMDQKLNVILRDIKDWVEKNGPVVGNNAEFEKLLSELTELDFSRKLLLSDSELSQFPASKMVLSNPSISTGVPLKDLSKSSAYNVMNIVGGLKDNGEFVFHPSFIDQALSGNIKSAPDLAKEYGKLDGAPKNLITHQRVQFSWQDGVSNFNKLMKLRGSVTNAVLDKTFGRLVSWISREPIYMLEYHLAMEELRPRIIAGVVSQDQAEIQAMNSSLQKMTKFIHNPMDRAAFERNSRIYSPFWFAKNQAYKRAFRLLEENPQAFMQYLKVNLAATNYFQTHSQNGQTILTIPHSEWLGNFLTDILTGGPSTKGINFGLSANISSLNSVFLTGDRTGWPMLENALNPGASALVSIPMKFLSSAGMANVPFYQGLMAHVLGPIGSQEGIWSDLDPSSTYRNAETLGLYEIAKRAGMDPEAGTIVALKVKAMHSMFDSMITDLIKQNMKENPYKLSGDQLTNWAVGTSEMQMSYNFDKNSEQGIANRQQFLDQANTAAQALFVGKILTSFALPVPTSLIEKFGSSAQLNAIMQQKLPDGSQIPLNAAYQEFAIKDPMGALDTVSTSQTPFGAFPQNQAYMSWAQKAPNLLSKDGIPFLAADLIPSNGSWIAPAHQSQISLGLRSTDTPKEYMDAVLTSMGDNIYYNLLAPAYYSNPMYGGKWTGDITTSTIDYAGSQALKKEAEAFGDNYNPTWLTNGSPFGSTALPRKIAVMNDLEKFVSSTSMQKEVVSKGLLTQAQVSTLVGAYTYYKNALPTIMQMSNTAVYNSEYTQVLKANADDLNNASISNVLKIMSEFPTKNSFNSQG